jgi:hypothetical protein
LLSFFIWPAGTAIPIDVVKSKTIKARRISRAKAEIFLLAVEEACDRFRDRVRYFPGGNAFPPGDCFFTQPIAFHFSRH